MRQKKIRWIWISILLFNQPICICLAGSRMLTIGRAADYIGSLPDGISIDPDGRLELNAALESIWKSDTDSACWTVKAGRDCLFFSTADDGKVYRRTGNQVELLFDSPHVALLSLLPAADGSLLAGSAPEGIIYKVDRNGDAKEFARTGSDYVWELLPTRDGIIAATGLPAAVIRFDTSGKQTGRIEIKADHIRTMVQDDRGMIWLGTANPARIYCLDGSDLQLVHEASAAEISAMAAAPDGIWFATVASPAITYTGTEQPEKFTPRKSDRKQEPVEQNSVWFIDATRSVSEVWSTTQVPIFDMIVVDNRPYVICGGDGCLVRIDGMERVSTLAARRQEPLTCLSAGVSGGIWVGAASAAELLFYSGKPADTGNIESVTVDAGTSAAWGRIRLHGENLTDAAVTIQTRSGNTSDPDTEWSEWNSTGSTGEIKSPPGRYLQWKAAMKTGQGSRPVIHSIDLSLKTGNRSPYIREVQVYPVVKGTIVDQPGRGTQFQQTMPDGLRVEYTLPSAVSNGLSKGMWLQLRGMRTIAWDSGDPDNDSLEYNVEIAPANRIKDWFVIGEHITQPLISFDSTTFPDGLYRIRLRVSDKPSNPHGEFLESECLSQVFEIDNTPPVFDKLRATITSSGTKQGWSILVTGSAEDNGLGISRLQYSLDNREWHNFTSNDGLLDQSRESFELRLNGVERNPVPSVLFLKVTDAHENMTTTTITVTVIEGDS